jgi:hypothetical protein
MKEDGEIRCGVIMIHHNNSHHTSSIEQCNNLKQFITQTVASAWGLAFIVASRVNIIVIHAKEEWILFGGG